MNYKNTLLLAIGNLNEEECKCAFEILSNERGALGKHEQKEDIFICPKDDRPMQCLPDDHYCRNHCPVRKN